MRLQKLKKFFSTDKPENWFLLISIIPMLFLSIFFPAGGGLDEFSHYGRSAQIGNGEFFSYSLDGSNSWVGGKIDQNAFMSIQSNTVKVHGKEDSYTFPYWSDKDIYPNHHATKDVPVAFTGAATYAPINYLPFSLGSFLSGLVTDNLYAQATVMRIFGAAFYITCFYFIIRMVPVGKWLFFAIALLPGMLSQASAITADTLSFCAIFAFLAQLLRILLIKKVGWKDFAILAAIAVVLSLIKTTYVPILSLMLLLPFLHQDIRRNKKHIAIVASIFIVSIVVCLLWYKSVSYINGGGDYTGRAIDPSAQVQYIMDNPIGYSKKLGSLFVVSFDVNKMLAPFWMGFWTNSKPFAPLGIVGAMGAATIIMSLFASERNRSALKKLRLRYLSLSMIALFAAIYTLSATALFVMFTTVNSTFIEGFQSRYYLPILLLILLPIFFLLNTRVEIRDKSGFIPKLLIISSATSSLLLMIFMYIRIYI